MACFYCANNELQPRCEVFRSKRSYRGSKRFSLVLNVKTETGFFFFCSVSICPQRLFVVSQDSVKSHSEVGKACVSLQILCRSQTDIAIEVASLSWLCRRLFVGQMLSSPIIAGNRFFKKQRKKNAGNRFWFFFLPWLPHQVGKVVLFSADCKRLKSHSPLAGWLSAPFGETINQKSEREASHYLQLNTTPTTSTTPTHHHHHHLSCLCNYTQ